MSKRKFCVVTGSRAEYGLLYWLLKEIQSDPELQLQLAVTGMHLSPVYGSTSCVVEQDGFHIDARIDIGQKSDSPQEITKAVGTGICKFADLFAHSRPDLLIILGDRFEILAAATAAMLTRIPIAHLHGGELTMGAIDDSIRHAITKMSTYHFVAAEPYRVRVIRMGESPERVLNFGAPGLDNISRLKLMERTELETDLGFKLRKPVFLVTLHSATLSDASPDWGIQNLLAAIERFPEASVIFTKPNADAGGAVIANAIDAFVARHGDRVMVASSLGQLRYLSVMRHCDVVIGNSSSAIVEAPALKKAAVNVGDRQAGRLLASSIISCREEVGAIACAIQAALSPAFRSKLESTESLYGAADASARIVKFLKTADLKKSKAFFDA